MLEGGIRPILRHQSCNDACGQAIESVGLRHDYAGLVGGFEHIELTGHGSLPLTIRVKRQTLGGDTLVIC